MDHHCVGGVVVEDDDAGILTKQPALNSEIQHRGTPCPG
jgi:hypothetical protein